MKRQLTKVMHIDYACINSRPLEFSWVSREMFFWSTFEKGKRSLFWIIYFSMDNINNQFEGSGENCRESWNVYVRIAVIKGIRRSRDKKGKLLVSLSHVNFAGIESTFFWQLFPLHSDILAAAPRVQIESTESRQVSSLCANLKFKIENRSSRNFFQHEFYVQVFGVSRFARLVIFNQPACTWKRFFAFEFKSLADNERSHRR